MPSQRLFEIIYLLMSGPMTAKALAQRFEVSTRTIYRDLETLSQAGIPIYTDRGKGGGIRLLDRFVLDRSVLTGAERRQLLAALEGMDALSPEALPPLRRLGALLGDGEEGWLQVDLSDWGCGSGALFSTVKAGILARRILTFDYYGSEGRLTHRTVEPLKLWFKSKAWYLQAFCRDRGDFRTFRLTRMKRPLLLDETFPPRALPQDPPVPGSPALSLKLWIDASQAYRVWDEFDEEQIQRQPDGSFIVSPTYPPGEWVFGMILSYGEHAQVLEPEPLRREIEARIRQMAERYGV